MIAPCRKQLAADGGDVVRPALVELGGGDAGGVAGRERRTMTGQRHMHHGRRRSAASGPDVGRVDEVIAPYGTSYQPWPSIGR